MLNVDYYFLTLLYTSLAGEAAIQNPGYGALSTSFQENDIEVLRFRKERDPLAIYETTVNQTAFNVAAGFGLNVHLGRR